MKKRYLLISAMVAVLSAWAAADQVKVPVGSQVQTMDTQTPAHGMTKSQVEANFGPPTSREGPVGDPPIYFWEYPDFTVYFESDRVIHSVLKHIPVTP